MTTNLLREALEPERRPNGATGSDLLDSVREAVAEYSDDGRWVTCSGCYECEDGYPNGYYPHSPDFGCTLGGGCSECGGIGAIWDTTDYAKYGEDMARRDEREKRAAVGDDGAQAVALEYLSEMDWLPDYVKQAIVAWNRLALSAKPETVEGEPFAHFQWNDGWNVWEQVVDSAAGE